MTRTSWKSGRLLRCQCSQWDLRHPSPTTMTMDSRPRLAAGTDRTLAASHGAPFSADDADSPSTRWARVAREIRAAHARNPPSPSRPFRRSPRPVRRRAQCDHRSGRLSSLGAAWDGRPYRFPRRVFGLLSFFLFPLTFICWFVVVVLFVCLFFCWLVQYSTLRERYTPLLATMASRISTKWTIFFLFHALIETNLPTAFGFFIAHCTHTLTQPTDIYMMMSVHCWAHARTKISPTLICMFISYRSSEHEHDIYKCVVWCVHGSGGTNDHWRNAQLPMAESGMRWLRLSQCICMRTCDINYPIRAD